MTSPIGTRIHITGGTNAGKSTLAARLARILGVAHVEMDALNWMPGWVSLIEVDPEAMRARLREATAGDGWVVDGDYARVTRTEVWPRLQTVIFLDLPRTVAVRRVLSRSWKRWRSKELLWGTNRESFWGQLALWRREESLVWWAWNKHAPKRQQFLQATVDPRWAHIHFVRLASQDEVEHFVARVAAMVDGGDAPATT